MKRSIILLLCVIFLISLTGCAQEGKRFKQGSSVKDILEAGLEKEKEAKAQENKTGDKEDEASVTEEPDMSSDYTGQSYSEDFSGGIDYEEIEALKNSTEGVDIDLSALSGTVAYSEVYHMMIAPEEYVGKTVKMSGEFAQYYDENAQKRYYACIIKDATACCANGIEFELTNDYVYPDDFPEDGGEICVVGEFDTYVENGVKYCTLRKCEKIF